MGSIEFPSTPIGATNGTYKTEQNGYRPGFSQLSLEGLDCEVGETLELGNCLVTSSVAFRKRVRGNEWRCRIRVEPDLMHPDQEGIFEAYALYEYADKAHSYHLRPGDRAVMQGVVRPEAIELENGETTTVNRFYVTSIEVIARSKRTSVTVYETHKEWC